MKTCEKCSIEHAGIYGSGRFCSSKCSRSFSSLTNREETNAKVSRTLSSKVILIEKVCPECSKTFSVKPSRSYRKTCSKACGHKHAVSRPETIEKLSIARTKAIMEGKTNFNSIKCTYMFRDQEIRCDSKIEYACLNYFETVFNAIEMKRCEEFIIFDDNGRKRRFIPDFIINTKSECFIVECKSFISVKKLNDKWRKYNELSLIKKEVLSDYAGSTGRTPFWFTKNIHLQYYNKPIAR